MAAQKGRDFILKWDSTGSGGWVRIGGMRTNAININGETIDVTTKDGTEWRKLLEGGTRSCSISGSGIFDSSSHLKSLRALSLNGGLGDFRLYDADGDYFEGSFRVPTFSQTGEYKGALEYSVSLESADEVTLGP